MYCKKNFDSLPTKLTEEIHFEVAPMAIPAMALLQQHDARRDIVIEPAARRRAAIEAQGHSELRAFGTGAQSGRKNPPACISMFGRATITLGIGQHSSLFCYFCYMFGE